MKMMVSFIIINFTRMENEQWKELRLLKLVTFAKAQRTVVAVSAKPLANLLARQAAVSLTNSAKIATNNSAHKQKTVCR